MQRLFWNYILILGCIFLQQKGVIAQVPGAVQVDPQNKVVDKLLDALGISLGIDGSKGPLVNRWYFWVIIAVLILLFIVGLYFTIRGFKRYAKTRREVNSIFEQAKYVEYFDPETEAYIKEVGRRTGRQPEGIAERAAAVKDISVTPTLHDSTNTIVVQVGHDTAAATK